MQQIIAFETEEELQKLTGLNRNELWQNGFNLDDWDIGFQTNKELGTGNLWWLEAMMDSYCCGYQVVNYKNKYYYMVYHS